jgi:hypothetical protein
MKYFAFLVLLIGNLAFAESNFEITEVTPNSVMLNQETLTQDTYIQYNFGNVRLNQSAVVSWNLRAKNVPLQIKGVFYQGDSDYDVYTNCPKVLPAGQVCSVGAQFRPFFQGYKMARIFVDLYTERFIIDLTGYGVR